MTDKYDNQIMNQVNDIITAMDGEATPDFNNDGKIQVQDQLDQIIKLLEGGGSSGVMVVNLHYDQTLDAGVLEKTWQEIYDATVSGIPVFIKIFDEEATQVNLDTVVLISTSGSDQYFIRSVGCNGVDADIRVFLATSPNDYPVAD